jgi:hypothetical protein
MDPGRFDLLTQRFAAANRRTLMRTALAAVAVLTTSMGRQARGQEGCPVACAEGEVCLGGLCQRVCETHRDCRSKKKDDPCVSNTCVEGVCVEAIIDCLQGYECCEGSCCPKTCTLDTDCAVLDPCLWGTCGGDGVCVLTQLDSCLTCESDAQCQTGGPATFCCEGICHRPCPSGMVMGKGCECDAEGFPNRDGSIVQDDASGGEGNNQRQRPRHLRPG